MTLPPPPPPLGASSLPPPPPPPDTRARGSWGLGDALAALGLYVLSAAVLGAAFVVVEGDSDALTGPWLPAFVIVPQVLMLGYVAAAVTRKGNGLGPDLGLRFQWIDLPLGLAIAVGGAIAAGVVGMVAAEILGEDPSAAVADLVEESSGGGGLTIWIVLVAIFGATLVPLTEELLFRGLVWSALEKRGLSSVLSLVISSVVFAAFHLEPFRTPVLIVLGLALGWGRLWTGRLGASVVAHAIINATAFATLLVQLS